MTAAVLGFQLMIVVSLAFARALGEDKLVLACVGWTIFTFIMVVMSPLILLQLIVIWGTFALLVPKNETALRTAATIVEKSPVEATLHSTRLEASSQITTTFAKPIPKQSAKRLTTEDWIKANLMESETAPFPFLKRIKEPNPDWLVNVDDVDWTEVGQVASIESRVKERAVTSLYHFTGVENLTSILRRGLMPASLLQQRAIPFRWNDQHRLDGHEDSISLSISHPNELLFYKWRMRDPRQRWVVLILDVTPLWTHDVAFYPRNAADHRMANLDRASLGDLASFDALFDDDRTRLGQSLLPSDPTDIQAEVMVFGVIEPRHIKGVVFSDSSSGRKWASELGTRPLHVHPERTGVFGRRNLLRSGKSA